MGQPKLMDEYREALRSRHYSLRTEQSYCRWVERFIRYHGMRHPAEMAEDEVNAYLTYLAVERRVSSSTQTQALSALILLYRLLYGVVLGDLHGLVRARQPQRLPVVMTRGEVRKVLEYLDGDKRLLASLMYGAGLRLMECLRLRVLDVDFDGSEITVRNGKGSKDRRTMLPDSLKPALERHLERVHTIHERDLRAGWGRVWLPEAIAHKYPNAPADWRWQWAFPQERRWRNPTTGQQGRHHVHPTLIQRAVKEAAREAGVTKNVGCHTFRHSFATHLLESGYDIRTIQELLGHKDVGTTMVYTHVLNKGGRGVKSPLDGE